MPVLLKTAAIILLLLVLLRLKVDLGLALLADAVLTAALFGLPAGAFLRESGQALIAGDTLTLLGVLVLVLYLGYFLQESASFRRMVEALQAVIRDPRLILAVPSAFIGLLPMMGGAMMGAPIVEEAAAPYGLSPAWMTFLNYWFRHIWEYCWPLYTNLILVSLILDVPIGRICLVQAPFTLLAAGAGLVALFRKVPRGPRLERRRATAGDYLRVVGSIWPIALTIALVFIARMDMLPALAAACLASQVLSRMPLKTRLQVVRRSVTPRVVLLTGAVMVFKRVLEASGALEAVVRAVPPGGWATYALLFAAPFLVGFLTGVNQAYVAIAFPLLAPIIGTGRPDMVLLLFAYVSGFVGILLSPAHLCLALTAEYFKADLKDVYRLLARPVAAVFAGALGVLLVGQAL
jgi:integral membrane protein (TIGR00529 family)